MTTIVDASVLCAYVNTEDVHHRKAKVILDDILHTEDSCIILTDHLFDETVNVIMRKKSKQEAVNFGKFIMDSEFLLVATSIEIFRRAWGMFQQTEKFSFTDCATIIFMEASGINKIATFDKEFRKIEWIKVVD